MVNLPNNVYNTLKWVTMVFLPSLATFYVALAAALGLPYAEQISGTIMAVVVLLGVFLQINTLQYKARVIAGKEPGIISLSDLHARFMLSNGVYDALKWITTILLPALSTLYVAVAAIWNLPYAEQVTSTISVIVLFLGALLQISSLQYRASIRLATNESAYEPNPMPNASVFSLKNDTYDKLKFISQGLLPALATFYVALATIWGLPYSQQVSATIMAIVLFMNGLLQVSTAKYNAAVRLVYSTSKVKAVTQETDSQQ
jgi:putative holin Dp-1